MKRLLILIPFLLLGVILGISILWLYAKPWPKYIAQEGDFEARFPIDPQVKRANLREIFPGEYLDISATTPDGIYSIVRCMRPANLDEEHLESLIIPYLTTRLGIAPDGLSKPKAFIFRLGKDGYVRGKSVWTSKYIYFIMIARQHSTDPSKDTYEQVFHQSFLVLK